VHQNPDGIHIIFCSMRLLVFVYLYNRTLQQLNRFHDRMISSQDVAISFLASTYLQDQALTSDLARILMSNVSSEVAQSPLEATGPSGRARC
jgi:hypothetical protein